MLSQPALARGTVFSLRVRGRRNSNWLEGIQPEGEFNRNQRRQAYELFGPALANLHVGQVYRNPGDDQQHDPGMVAQAAAHEPQRMSPPAPTASETNLLTKELAYTT